MTDRLSLPSTPSRPLLFRVVAVALATMMGAAACSSGSSSENGQTTPTTDLGSGEIVLTSGLAAGHSCDDLLDRLQDEALERVGPYGFGDGNIGIFEGEIVEEAAVDDAAESTAEFDAAAPATTANASRAADGEGGNDFSGTNNQESSVDEADLVKTDGRRLVTVSQNKVHVIDVTGNDPRLETTIKLPDEFWGGELFLNGDSALLMTSGWTDVPFLPVDTGVTRDLAWYPGMPTGRLMELDLERGRIVRTLEFEGTYLSAREVEGTIRIALSATANRFAFVFPSNSSAEKSAEEFNRALIADSTIEQWIPTYRITEGDGLNPDVVAEGPIVECDRVHLPSEFAGFGSLVILTTDLDDGLSLGDTVSVFTDAQTVYASTDRMAVATPRWPTFDPETGEPEDDANYRTAIHTFDITNPNRADYVASGTVTGHLLSQYSLSEYDGYLRVATTAGTPWNSIDSESFITVLDERDRELVPVGQVGGLGEGERIFAVRFMAERAYVVTFEQIDPLYTLDLSDPTNPTVDGELKIPGFSTYLHPLGDGLLLGIGVDGDESGATGGSVVSLFDVSDPADPIRLDKLPLSNLAEGADNVFGSSHTPVNNDPRAFTYWDETAIIPIGWWQSSEQGGRFLEIGGTEAVMVQVDDDRLVEVGRVGHPFLRQCEGPEQMTSDYLDPEDVETLMRTGTLGDTPANGLDPDTDNGDDEDQGESGDQGSGDAEASFVEDPPAEEEPAPSILPGPESYCWIHAPEIIRTVVIGDSLYTVSPNGVGVHDFDSGSRLEWIPFERL